MKGPAASGECSGARARCAGELWRPEDLQEEKPRAAVCPAAKRPSRMAGAAVSARKSQPRDDRAPKTRLFLINFSVRRSLEQKTSPEGHSAKRRSGLAKRKTIRRGRNRIKAAKGAKPMSAVGPPQRDDRPGRVTPQVREERNADPTNRVAHDSRRAMRRRTPLSAERAQERRSARAEAVARLQRRWSDLTMTQRRSG